MLNQSTSGTENVERYRERIANISSEFELGLFLFLARKSIIWVMIIFAIAFGGAFLYLRYTPYIYESKGVLQIKTSNTASRVLNVQSMYETEDALAQGIELMRSKVFLKRVLSKLPLQVSYFSEGTFKANELYTSSPYYVEFNLKNVAAYGIKRYVNFVNEKQGEITFQREGAEITKKFETGEWVSFPFADIRITVNNYNAITEQQNQVKQNSFYFVINDPDQLTAEHFQRLNVKPLNTDARTVEISFTDNNPKKCADIVQAVSEEFLSYDVETKNESAKKVLAFIDTQMVMVYERLRGSETSLQEFQKTKKINPNEKVTLANQERMNTFEDQIIQLELQENVLKEIEKRVNGKDKIDTYALLSLLAGSEFESSMSKLITSLQEKLQEKQDLLYRVTPESEKARSVDYQIEVQKKLLLESIGSIKDKIGIRKQNLEKKSNEFEQKLYQLPTEELEYNRLQRLFSINEKFYNLLLEKKTEYSISEAGNVSQHIILEKASVPSQPISPNKKLVLITSMLAGVLCSLVLIFFRYIIHDQITSLNEITKLTNASISILGIVPKYKKEIPVSQLLVDKNPKSLIAEAFRSIRTNLQFISNVPGAKLMAVTSTISGEGKTFVAINLAGIIAYSGKRVIVLDLDMRKPKIHIGFNAENVKGMSTILIGKDLPDDCIQHSNQENLDFITAGPIPPNPSELIISRRMEEILEYLKGKYDVVVVDNPPVGLVTDGVATIQKADYPVYIFRADYSKRNFVQNVDRLFNENGIKKISIILNGVDIQRKTYGYNYGYGYGYGYGQGYGYGYYDDVNHQEKRSLIKKVFQKN